VTRAARAVVAAVIVAAALGGCHHASQAPADRPVAIVAAREATGADIVISAGERSSTVPAGLRKPLAPLLAARVLDRPEPPASYGLDHPQAQLKYATASGQTVVVLVGAPDFDHHFLYVSREGDGRVFLVPTVVLRPVLALAGASVAEPS
jgi:Domain of unknown function (DUF4340)